MPRIRVDEWLAELARVADDSPEGFTTRDVATKFGWLHDRAAREMRRWFDEGRIRCAGTRPAQGMDGRHIRIPVYQMVAVVRAKRKKNSTSSNRT